MTPVSVTLAWSDVESPMDVEEVADAPGSDDLLIVGSVMIPSLDISDVGDDAVDDAPEPVSSVHVDVGDDAVDDDAPELVSYSHVDVGDDAVDDDAPELVDDDEVIDLNRRGTQDFFRATALASDDSYLVIPNSEVFCCYIFITIKVTPLIAVFRLHVMVAKVDQSLACLPRRTVNVGSLLSPS